MAPGGSTVLKYDHLHIEASSICSLKCPRCPRAEVAGDQLDQQLDLEFFQKQIGHDVMQQVKKITFCGNDGDPIYCRDLVDICVWIKTCNPGTAITIITNGSGRPTDWWEYLGHVLGDIDEIHWSIDGWDQLSNNLYRVNSRWDSIMKGIAAFSRVNHSTYRVWASIAFRFNEWNLADQQFLAHNLGFDLYQLTKSTKFGSKYPDAYGTVDLLEPTQSDLVAQGHRFQRNNIYLTPRQRPGSELKEIFLRRAQDLDKQNAYSGICLIGNKGIYINSHGLLYPCCWTANRYEHNQDWHQQAAQKFNLWQRTFQDILEDPFWHTDFLRFDSQECRTKCTPDRLQDRDHTVEW